MKRVRFRCVSCGTTGRAEEMLAEASQELASITDEEFLKKLVRCRGGSCESDLREMGVNLYPLDRTIKLLLDIRVKARALTQQQPDPAPPPAISPSSPSSWSAEESRRRRRVQHQAAIRDRVDAFALAALTADGNDLVGLLPAKMLDKETGRVLCRLALELKCCPSLAARRYWALDGHVIPTCSDVAEVLNDLCRRLAARGDADARRIQIVDRLSEAERLANEYRSASFYEDDGSNKPKSSGAPKHPSAALRMRERPVEQRRQDRNWRSPLGNRTSGDPVERELQQAKRLQRARDRAAADNARRPAPNKGKGDTTAPKKGGKKK